MPRLSALADAKRGAVFVYTIVAGALALLATLFTLASVAVTTGRILERTEVVAATVSRMEQDQAQLLRERNLALQEWSAWRRGTDFRLDHLELRPASR